MSYNTKGIVEGGKYIRPGISEVVLASVEGNEPEGTGHFLELKFRLPNSEETTGIRLYMGEKSQDISMSKLKHMATKIVTETALNGVEANDLVSYGAKLNKILSGKKIRMKFIAKEYRNAKGEVKVKPDIPMKYFAEAIIEGAEYPAVSAAQSQLTYDPNNQYDYIKLVDGPATDDTMITGKTGTIEDKLPWE